MFYTFQEKSENNSAVKHVQVKNVTHNKSKRIDESHPSGGPSNKQQKSDGAKNHRKTMEASNQDEKKLNDDVKLENGFEDTAIDDVDIGNTENAVDQTDAASVFSLYMESTPRYYFQHPWCRVGIAYIVTICNFFIYAQDPVAHSLKEANVPVIGHDFAFIFMRYPPNAWSLLKVFLWFAAIIVGLLIGKLLCHHLLFSEYFVVLHCYHLKGRCQLNDALSLCFSIYAYIGRMIHIYSGLY